MVVEECARAKVNLYLHVTGRRADGYHLLDSVAVFPGAADLVRAEAADGLSLAVEGPFRAGLAAEADNLVLRAARAWATAAGRPARGQLTLVKHLPVASGIGGGSADAAAALRAMARLWDVPMPDAALLALAAGLGADVAVCVASRPARMSGVGEVLGAAPVLPRFGMVLVNPRLDVSTPAVFRLLREGRAAFSPVASLPPAWPDARAMAADLKELSNDLEAPAQLVCPAIGEVLTWLRARPGCLLARMSGSGATCFGLFAEPEAAAREAACVPAAWWGWGGAGSA